MCVGGGMSSITVLFVFFRRHEALDQPRCDITRHRALAVDPARRLIRTRVVVLFLGRPLTVSLRARYFILLDLVFFDLSRYEHSEAVAFWLAKKG